MVLFNKLMATVVDDTACADVDLAGFAEETERLFVILAEQELFLNLPVLTGDLGSDKILREVLRFRSWLHLETADGTFESFLYVHNLG